MIVTVDELSCVVVLRLMERPGGAGTSKQEDEEDEDDLVRIWIDGIVFFHKAQTAVHSRIDLLTKTEQFD